jgi:hypothetical protein
MDIKIDDKIRLRSDKRCFYLATTQIAGDNAKEPGKKLNVHSDFTAPSKAHSRGTRSTKCSIANARPGMDLCVY